jgi:hypothetical protein
MDHHYGRYGPHAWLRWHERHYGHQSPVVRPVVAVVVIHVPKNIERVIFIIMTDETQKDIVVGTVDTTFTEQLSEGDFHDPYHDLKLAAKTEGIKKAREDISRFKSNTLEEIPSEEELYDDGQDKGFGYIQQNNPDAFATTQYLHHLSDIYARTFVEGYSEWREDRTGDGTLPDKATRQVLRKARTDKFEDHHNGITLPENQVTYQAVMCAVERLEPDTHNKAEYLQKIEHYVYIYVPAYLDHDPRKEREDRSNRSNPFPK